MAHPTLAHSATAANGSGKNKDGGVGAATQAPVLTTPQPSRHPSPTTKATTLGYLIFERPDLDLAEKYLTDFGLRVVSRDADRLFLRGTGEAPYCYVAVRAEQPRFAGSASPSRRLTICENSAAFPAPPRSRTSIGPAGGSVSASPIPPASASTPSGDRPRPSRWRTVPRSRSTPGPHRARQRHAAPARRPARGNQAGAHSPSRSSTTRRRAPGTRSISGSSPATSASCPTDLRGRRSSGSTSATRRPTTTPSRWRKASFADTATAPSSWSIPTPSGWDSR